MMPRGRQCRRSDVEVDTVSLLVHSARRIDAGGEHADAWAFAVAGQIGAVGVGTTWREHVDGPAVPAGDAVVVDACGDRLVPGFVDVHSHGGGGHRFEDGPDAIAAALQVHRQAGTTRSVVSLASSDTARLARSLSDVADLSRRDPLVVGAHLEGPFLSPQRRGAHDPRALRLPSVAEVDLLADAADGTLRQLTLAPELPGAIEVIDHLVARGVVAAVGHTAADYDQTRAAFDAGATLMTHAYNAMAGIGHRAPGPVVAALDHEGVYLEIINDGRHVDRRVVAMTFALAPGRVALVSDAVAAAGLGDGVYRLGSREVTVAGGVARLTRTETLAGSTVTLSESLRHAVAAGISPVDAVAAVTSVPACALGLAGLGRVAVGYAADLVLLDDDWRVSRVFAAGEEVRTVQPGR
jgi:N-acetylglucosamine-6-phosphate deacetylase